jgi:hypothetical protein
VYVNRPTTLHSKCLHSMRPLDGPESLKCLPNRAHSLKCLLNRCVTIHFPPIFLYYVVCSEYGQYCSSPALLVHRLMHARWFGGCCLLLFDSTLQSWGPAAALGPLGACSLVCCFHVALVCFNFARLSSCIRSWTSCCSLHGWGSTTAIRTALLSFPIDR